MSYNNTKSDNQSNSPSSKNPFDKLRELEKKVRAHVATAALMGTKGSLDDQFRKCDEELVRLQTESEIPPSDQEPIILYVEKGLPSYSELRRELQSAEDNLKHIEEAYPKAEDQLKDLQSASLRSAANRMSQGFSSAESLAERDRRIADLYAGSRNRRPFNLFDTPID